MSHPPVQLGEVLERVERRVIVKPDENYRFVGVRSFGAGCFDAGERAGGETRYRELLRVEADDFVFPKLMAWEGAFAVVPGSLAGYVVSPEFCTFRAKPNLDIDFLAFLFKRPETWQQVAGASIGTNVRRRRLYPHDLLRRAMDIPELKEQRRIAKYLSGVLGLAAALEPRFRPESVDALVGLYPAVAERYLAAFAAGCKRLTDLVDFVSDVVHPGEDPRPADVFVGLQHIQSHTGQRIGGDAIGGETGRKFRFAPGDVVYGYLRPYLNKVWVADRHGLCSVDQYVLRPKEGISAELLAHAMRSRRFLLEAIELTHRLQLPRLRSGPLGRIEVPVVPPEAAEHILASLDAILGRVLSLRDLRVRQKRNSQALEASVLHAAFGE